MKRISEFRKLLGVDKDSTLKDLKTIYRNFMKDWHPDKFHGDEEKLQEAELKSKQFIEAYHFLVSIAPETIEQALPEYTTTINASTIDDFSYSKQTLQLNFIDGSSYEYFEVPKAIYMKLINSDSPARFSRRHIYHAFIYRKVSKAIEEA